MEIIKSSINEAQKSSKNDHQSEKIFEKEQHRGAQLEAIRRRQVYESIVALSDPVSEEILLKQVRYSL